MIKTVVSGIPADKSVSKGNAVICPLNSYLSSERVVFPFKTANAIKRKILNHVYDRRWNFRLTLTISQIRRCHWPDKNCPEKIVWMKLARNYLCLFYSGYNEQSTTSNRRLLPVNRENVLSVVFEFPYTRFSFSFLCPTLVTCWLINFHICFTELKGLFTQRWGTPGRWGNMWRVTPPIM